MCIGESSASREQGRAVSWAGDERDEGCGRRGVDDEAPVRLAPRSEHGERERGRESVRKERERESSGRGEKGSTSIFTGRKRERERRRGEERLAASITIDGAD